MAEISHARDAKPLDKSASGTAVRRRGRSRRGAVAVEAALVLSVVVALMLGLWEAGRLIQVSMLLNAAAREGARIAAGGTNDGSTATVAMIQQAVKDFLTAAGLPSAAVDGTQVQVINRGSNSWTDPGNATQLDHFRVTVTIPAGDAFNSLRWLFTNITGITQLSAQADWLSANDTQVVVSSQLPL